MEYMHSYTTHVNLHIFHITELYIFAELQMITIKHHIYWHTISEDSLNMHVHWNRITWHKLVGYKSRMLPECQIVTLIHPGISQKTKIRDTTQIFRLLGVRGILSSIMRAGESRTTEQYAITGTQRTLITRINAHTFVYGRLFHKSNKHLSPHALNFHFLSNSL